MVELAQGDMRKVLNILQSASTAFPKIDENAVYVCVGHPLKSDITNIVKWLLNDDFLTTYNRKLPVIYIVELIIIWNVNLVHERKKNFQLLIQ